MNGVRWLLAGAGDIATRRVAPALIETENSELIAICDILEESAVKLAERSGVKDLPLLGLFQSGIPMAIGMERRVSIIKHQIHGIQ